MIATRGNFGKRPSLLALAAAALLAITVSAQADFYGHTTGPEGTPVPVEAPSIKNRTGTIIPLDLEFTTSEGKRVKLGDLYNHNRPVVLSLVYFKCTSLCIYTQQDLAGAARTNPRGLEMGRDFDVIFVSIDPDDLPGEAAAKKMSYLDRMGRKDNPAGLTYLTGNEENIQKLAEAVGFGFKRNYGLEDNDASGKFAHSAGIFVTTSYGRISQTILGIAYSEDTLHNALLVAGNGQIGGGLLGVGLSCGAVHFNPRTGKYEHNPWFWAGTAVGGATFCFMGLFLGSLWMGELKRKRRGVDAPDSAPHLPPSH